MSSIERFPCILFTSISGHLYIKDTFVSVNCVEIEVPPSSKHLCTDESSTLDVNGYMSGVLIVGISLNAATLLHAGSLSGHELWPASQHQQ